MAPAFISNKSTCSIDGCGRASARKGWCTKHYYRWRRGGDPRGVRTENGAPRQFLAVAIAFEDAAQCLIWPFARNAGYAVISNDGMAKSVHPIVCTAAHGPAPTPGHEAAHTCGHGSDGCVNPRHLRWATHAENMADMITHGTSPRGERQGCAKLTRSEVLEIARLRGSRSQRKLADDFGVSRGAIGGIFSGHNWAWLTEMGAK